MKYTCFKLRRRIGDLFRWRIILTALFAAALGALLGQLGDAFKGELIYSQWKFDFLENWHNPCISAWFLHTGIGLLLTIFVAFLLYLSAYRLIPVRHIRRVPVGKPKVGIFFLSPKTQLKEYKESGAEWILENRGAKENEPKEGAFVSSGDLHKDIEAISSIKVQWTWQQLLRFLRMESTAPVLERIYLLASKGSKGSFGDIDLAKELLANYMPRSAIIAMPHAYDFESVEELYQALDKLISEIVRELGVKEHEIIVDYTGGHKTTSVAAALASLHRDVLSGYVNNSGDYITYDFQTRVGKD